MSSIRRRFLVVLVLSLATASVAHAADSGSGFKSDPYVRFRKPARPRDLTKEFVQKTADFSLEYAGKRVSPTMAGFIYHGERIEGNHLLLASRHGDTRGWAPVTDIIPLADAEAFFSKEIQSHPGDSFPVLMRGLVRFEKNDVEPALADLNETLRLDSKNVAALVTRAVLWIIKQRPDQALADASRAVVLAPRNAYAYEQRAMILCSVKNDDAALKDFEQAIELGSKWVMIFLARGEIYLKKGDLDNAKTEIEHAILIDPDRVDAFLYLAIIHMKRSELDKALATVDKAIQIDPGFDEAYAARAVIHHARGDQDQAMKDLNEAIHLDPQNAMHIQNRASLKLEKGQYEAALADVEAAIRLDPNHAESQHGRASILAACPLVRLRNPQKAIVSAKRACELANFQEPRYLSTLAIAYSETGDFAEAVKWQQKALDVLPANDPERREYTKLLKRYQSKKPYHRLGLLEEIGLKSPAIAAKSGARNPD
jgi:tetratricopeptide (TPR) repeat protein